MRWLCREMRLDKSKITILLGFDLSSVQFYLGGKYDPTGVIFDLLSGVWSLRLGDKLTWTKLDCPNKEVRELINCWQKVWCWHGPSGCYQCRDGRHVITGPGDSQDSHCWQSDGGARPPRHGGRQCPTVLPDRHAVVLLSLELSPARNW